MSYQVYRVSQKPYHTPRKCMAFHPTRKKEEEIRLLAQ